MMSDEAAAAARPDELWSSGLGRSYSEHAALMLKQLESQRGKHHYLHNNYNNYSSVPEQGPKCTRSGPEFRQQLEVSHSEADDEDEDEEPCKDSESHKSWRLPTSTCDYEDKSVRRKINDIGCRGDSNDISTGLSEMSIDGNNYSSKCSHRIGAGDGSIGHEFSSPSFKTNFSSLDIRCQRFDDDFFDSRGNFMLLEHDSDFLLSDEMKYIQRLEQNDYLDGNHTDPCHGMIESESSTTVTLSSDKNRRRPVGKPLKRKISYENWATDKQRELERRKLEQRMAEDKRREREEAEQRAKKEKERRDYENYVEWVKRKQKEKLLKKKLMEKELCLQQRIREVEDKAKLAKNICLKQWSRKKEEQQKAMEKQEALKRQKEEEEKMHRTEESVKAYEKWRAKAKNTPKPATQGLLPHQTAKPAFTNPQPWQPLVDYPSDESEPEVKPKPSGTTIKSVASRRSIVKR